MKSLLFLNIRVCNIQTNMTFIQRNMPPFQLFYQERVLSFNKASNDVITRTNIGVERKCPTENKNRRKNSVFLIII